MGAAFDGGSLRTGIAELDDLITALDRANAIKIAQAEEGQKRPELKKRREDILARQRAGKATREDEIELRVLNTRLGQWASADTAAKPPRRRITARRSASSIA